MALTRGCADSVVMTTGAASGIGLATAIAVAAQGATVVLAAPGHAALDTVAERRRGMPAAPPSSCPPTSHRRAVGGDPHRAAGGPPTRRSSAAPPTAPAGQRLGRAGRRSAVPGLPGRRRRTVRASAAWGLAAAGTIGGRRPPSRKAAEVVTDICQP
jgi:hypothetical protein